MESTLSVFPMGALTHIKAGRVFLGLCGELAFRADEMPACRGWRTKSACRSTVRRVARRLLGTESRRSLDHLSQGDVKLGFSLLLLPASGSLSPPNPRKPRSIETSTSSEKRSITLNTFDNEVPPLKNKCSPMVGNANNRFNVHRTAASKMIGGRFLSPQAVSLHTNIGVKLNMPGSGSLQVATKKACKEAVLLSHIRLQATFRGQFAKWSHTIAVHSSRL